MPLTAFPASSSSIAYQLSHPGSLRSPHSCSYSNSQLPASGWSKGQAGIWCMEPNRASQPAVHKQLQAGFTLCMELLSQPATPELLPASCPFCMELASQPVHKRLPYRLLLYMDLLPDSSSGHASAEPDLSPWQQSFFLSIHFVSQSTFTSTEYSYHLLTNLLCASFPTN